MQAGGKISQNEINLFKLAFNQGSVPCPGGDGCLPESSMCDGLATCGDASDEDPSWCAGWPCAPGMVKCPDNIQCIPRRDLCHKALWRHKHLRGTNHVGRARSCVNGGTNSIQSCRRSEPYSPSILWIMSICMCCSIGINCTDPDYWQCGQSDSDECISRYFVCDGVSDCEVGATGWE